MTSKSKPKLRRAPPLATLAEQQDAAQRLLLLDKWTEEPNNPPPTGLAATLVAPEPPAAPSKSKAVPVPPKKPWEQPGVEAPHPYHLICTERLFQKIDFVWKRLGNKSMREWVLTTLEGAADKELKQMGEN
jgi:hypothetical protein